MRKVDVRNQLVAALVEEPDEQLTYGLYQNISRVGRVMASGEP